MSSTNVNTVRADELQLGDVIVSPSPWWRESPSGIDTLTVRLLALIGDDVEVNGGALTTSIGNTLTVVRAVR